MLALCAANAAYLVGLESALTTPTALVAGTGAPLMRMLRRADVVATSVDEHLDVMDAIEGPLSSGVVLGAAPIAELLEERGCDAVLPFKSGARLWTMAEWQHLRVLAAPHRLTRQLENKLALADIAQAADARIPDTVTIRLDDDLVAAARADGIALPRVFQPAIGFAGAGTVLVHNADDLAALVAEHAAAGSTGVGKLVEFVDGEPVTVNGVVIPPDTHGADADGAVLVGMIARQLTGIPGLTPTEFGSCGNEWSLPPARESVTAVRSLAHRVGEELGRRGFAGAFGIDIVLPSGGGIPTLIEINPRWTASLALQVELQAERGLPTLLDAHLAAFKYHPEARASLPELLAAYGTDEDAGCTRGTLEVSTVIAYNATAGPVRVNPDFEPGVWRLVGDDIERVRDGWRASDLRAPEEFVAIPSGTSRDIAAGSYLVRVVRRGISAIDARANDIRPVARVIMDRVVARVTASADR